MFKYLYLNIFRGKFIKYILKYITKKGNVSMKYIFFQNFTWKQLPLKVTQRSLKMAV